MAITLSTLAEEILNRQERAVIRGIYRASQLNEALSQIEKIMPAYSNDAAVKNELMSQAYKQQCLEIKDYLLRSIANAIINTKVPATAPVRKKNDLPASDAK